ncbi:MAG TPA: hypothetical protein VJ852_11990 [Gemmatimonadaceae bacterium]|nr:hypothetical protein [Gemmatimonadaceae bacterium]
MRRFSVALMMLLLIASAANAQRRGRVFTSDPDSWATVSIAGFRANGVNDGATGSTWDFGNSTNLEYRASLEKGWNNGSSFGIAGSYARMPFVYSSDLAIPLSNGALGARCSPGCNAHLDMMTLLANFHVGSGIGFHQVLELNGGAVFYENLKRDSDGAKLAGSGNVDPIFGVNYGFGWGFSDRTSLDFTWDYAFAIHERENQSNSVSNTNQMPGLRVMLRMGFGARSFRR